MLVSLPLHCCSSIWIEINIKLQIVLFVGRMIFLVSIGILRTWGRGAVGGDTSKAFHRILIDATLKAFRSRIHGNLKNPISQLRPLLLSEVEQKANFTHPTLVKLQNLCPFLAFFARIWLWKLDSGKVGSLWKFCQAKLYMPGQCNGRREKMGSKPNPLCGIFAPRPALAINSPGNTFLNIKAFRRSFAEESPPSNHNV